VSCDVSSRRAVPNIEDPNIEEPLDPLPPVHPVKGLKALTCDRPSAGTSRFAAPARVKRASEQHQNRIPARATMAFSHAKV
jgi:hypothetical protein